MMAVRQAARRQPVTPANTFLPVDFSRSPSLVNSTCSSALHAQQQHPAHQPLHMRQDACMDGMWTPHARMIRVTCMHACTAHGGCMHAGFIVDPRGCPI